MKYVYQFLYCSCIYESAYATMSIHESLVGAYKAMKEHRLKIFNEWRERPNIYRNDFKDTFSQSWTIQKTEIKP